MIILVGFTVSTVLLGSLWVTLGVLVLFILYRKLIKRLQKGNPQPDNYCVLYGLETDPASGEVEFYFTTKQTKKVLFELLDSDFQVLKVLFEKEISEGGQIVRFDTRELKNGEYFYRLLTDNQKTMKKMRIENREAI